MQGTVLIVDDQQTTRRVLTAELEDAGFSVVSAADGAEGWERFCEHRPDLVITDMVMPRSDGMDLLRRIRSRSEVPVILFSAHGSVQTAVTAIQTGADDFISSADFDADDFAELVKRVLARSRESQTVTDLDARLVGASKRMARVRERVAGLAPLWTPVLISGEAGSGCDAVARTLHDLGATAGSPFVRIDAASFNPGDPVPSEGAVYLDGVEKLSAEGQRWWSRRISSDNGLEGARKLRVLVSTTEPLSGLVGAGRFDATFADALLRFEIELPALRERKEDIPALAEALVQRATERLGRRKVEISSEAIELLQAQKWSGNVAQLSQLLERAVAFFRGQQIRRSAIEELLGDSEESLASIRAHHDAQERESLIRAIRDTGGNISQAAERLGKSRSAVYRLIEKHGVRLTRKA